MGEACKVISGENEVCLVKRDGDYKDYQEI